EGFCIPMLEAMQFELPVVVYGVGAVSETAGDGALVLDDKSPMMVAATVARVLGDSALRSTLVGAGRRRADQFSLERGRERWAAALEEVLREAAGTAAVGTRT
ncbi:MAG: glycosyltransferase, partial [Acidimicrobiales bacterium]